MIKGTKAIPAGKSVIPVKTGIQSCYFIALKNPPKTRPHGLVLCWLHNRSKFGKIEGLMSGGEKGING